MRLQAFILLLVLFSCKENKIVETPMVEQEENIRKEEPTTRPWEEEIHKQLTAASLSHKISLHEFISKVRLHHAVKGVQMTKSGFLYISVVNNGADKTPAATQLCRLARQLAIREIKGIKIIDVNDAMFYENQTASGTELGISVCNLVKP
jgi:hypothetical protein